MNDDCAHRPYKEGSQTGRAMYVTVISRKSCWPSGLELGKENGTKEKKGWAQRPGFHGGFFRGPNTATCSVVSSRKSHDLSQRQIAWLFRFPIQPAYQQYGQRKKKKKKKKFAPCESMASHASAHRVWPDTYVCMFIHMYVGCDTGGLGASQGDMIWPDRLVSRSASRE